MKILIIDDDKNIIEEVRKQIESNGSILIEFIPESLEPVKAIEQVKNLYKNENFDFVLLDYKLWGDLNGDHFSREFKNLNIPFIGFSSDFNHNTRLVSFGAFTAINKNSLYGSRGFNGEKFFEKFKEAIKNK